MELAIVLFNYCPKGITGIVNTYCGLREPAVPISEAAYNAHGLTISQLEGKQLDAKQIAIMIRKADYLVSYGAEFTKHFTSTLLPIAKDKQWYCTRSGISWSGGKILRKILDDHSIDSVAPHGSLSSALAIINLLSKRAKSGKTYFAEMVGS